MHDLPDMFYDPAGQPMERRAWRKRYLKRLTLRETRLLGVVVLTQFVGINHARGGGTPKIYETGFYAVRPEGLVFVSSWWSGGHRRALVRHVLSLVAVVLGGWHWSRRRARGVV